MVPRLAAEGSSFHGAFLYYCHDKKAQTSARVAWTQTVNMITDQAEKAWKVMAYTAKVATELKRAAGKKRAGDQIEKPVISYSLSWHPEQNPDKETMLAAAKESIAKLKLSEHEAMIVAHNDKPQPHVHVVINRIHPLTGMAANLYRSKRKLQSWARKFQRKEGTMYCPKREENHQKRKNGQHTKYVDPVINEAWKNSHDAQGFISLLELKDYQLAQGRKRLVIVDAHGKTVNPVRHLEGVRAKEFNDRMAGINTQMLRTPEAILKARQIKNTAPDKSISEQDAHDQKEDPKPQSIKAPEEIHSEQTADQPEKDAKLNAYEDRVAAATNELGLQHYKAWKQTAERHEKIIETKRTELTEHYKLDKRQEAIDTLQKRLNAPRLIPKFARKLFRIDRKLEIRLGNLQDQQAKAKKCFDDAMTKVSKGRDNALQSLDAQHSQDKRNFTKRLEQWRPSTLSQEFNRSQQQRAHDLHPEKQNDGPSLSL